MFTNGVVASVKICGDGDDDAPPVPTAVSACGLNTASERGVADESGSGGAGNTDGAAAASGPAPQEGFET